jgi:hypothetical protein
MPKIGFSRNYFAEEKPVDHFHKSVDHAGPAHHGPTAVADLGSSSELSLRPLWGSWSPAKGGGGRGKLGGPDSGLIGARKAAERRRNDDEVGGGEALSAGSLGVGREGKEGRGRSGRRRGCRGALL